VLAAATAAAHFRVVSGAWGTGRRHATVEPHPRLGFDATTAVMSVGVVASVLGALQMRGRVVVGDWGLVAKLPVAWMVFTACAVVAFGRAVLASRNRPWVLPASLVMLVVALQGVAVAAYRYPRYSWLYKHAGVVDWIVQHGHLARSIDIYQNWPGFFALIGWTMGVGGIHDPLAIARWWPLAVNLLVLPLLAYTMRSFTRRPIVVWIALALFTAGNWVGQDYFSPQSLAFLLSFGVFGLLFNELRGDRDTADVTEPTMARPWAIVACAGVFACVVVTHQLTPYLVLPGIAVAAAIGRTRPRWIVFVLAGTALGYLAPRWSFVRAHGGLGATGVLTNLRTPTVGDAAHAQLAVMASSWSSRALTGLLVVGAIVGIFTIRRRLDAITLAAQVLGVAAVLALQSYGNEAVLRATLFASPWLAFLSAGAVVTWFATLRAPAAAEPPATEPNPVSPRGASVVTAVVAVMALCFVVATSAIDGRYEILPGEVAVERSFETTAPAHAWFVQLGPGHFPIKLTDRYPDFHFVAVLPFSAAGDLSSNGADIAVNDLAATLRTGAGGAPVYLAVSAGGANYSALYGYATRSQFNTFIGALNRSSDWQVAEQRDDALLYRLAAS
jgi:hypothetical protein